MDVQELVANHPRLYHMAASDSWPGIGAHGLLSTSALLDLFEVGGSERWSVESERRPEAVRIRHPDHGYATIRDNKPMTTSALEKCLHDGVTPNDWYRLLNGMVFFWLTPERVDGLLAARAYRDRPHLVLELDSASLLRAHLESVSFSPINSGATLYNPQQRGLDTFLTVAEYPWEEYRRRRGRQKAIAELTVGYRVADVMDHLVEVSLRHPDGRTERVAP